MRMRPARWPNPIVGVAVLVLMTSCSRAHDADEAPAAAAGANAQASRELTAYLDAEYEKELQMKPETLTAQGRKDQYDKLDDRSDAAADRELAWRRRSVADMKARFDPARLDEEARTSFEMWDQALQTDEKRHQFRRYPYLVSELGGDHTGLPQFLITQHRVDEASDIEAYISRVGRIGAALDQDLANANAAAAAGIRMPRFMYAKAASEARRVTSGAPFGAGKDSALFADGKAKIAALLKARTITDADAERLTGALSKALADQMKPAYDRFIAWLEADRPNTTVDAKGAGALPNGAAYYNAALSIQTTTEMTADQIHQLGLDEVKRLRGEMERVKERIGYKGPLEEFFKALRADRTQDHPNTDAGRAAYLKQAEDDLAAVKARLPQYFGILPKAPLVVRRVEGFREVPGGAQHYEPGTPDGSRPGIFYVHLADLNQEPKYQLATIAYHEGLPGHHLQIAIAQERAGLPRFRTHAFYTAYVEGWGLYAEGLAKEMGFDSDPYDDFGRLSGEIWRAIRLVLDTGIHAQGWSEDRAVAYFMQNSAQPEDAIRSEVRRYITVPGQATCYKIGMITMQKLRDDAKAALGDKFDYRAFHDVVLGGGALPLPVLQARVRRWIAAQKTTTAN